MSSIKLITVSDDRSNRKGGKYQSTQGKIKKLLKGWIDQKHYTIKDIINCDSLMVNEDPAKNGRVYKPWVIQKELAKMQDGDFLIYNDCSPEMWPDDINMEDYDLEVIKRLTVVNHDFLVGFVKWDDKQIEPGQYGIHTHHNFTLDSCMDIMQYGSFRHSFLCASGMICIRKTPATVKIVEDWLYFNSIKECACMNVDETENSYHDGKPGQKLGNRHDQSVLSLLLNHYNYDYCDIVYNDLNPYNFLNFCRKDQVYQFINSNVKS